MRYLARAAWFALGASVGAAASAVAASGESPADQWISVVMSAGAMLFGGGALWKVGGVAREFGRLEQRVTTTDAEVTRLRDRSVLGDVYAADSGRIEQRLRALEERL